MLNFASCVLFIFVNLNIIFLNNLLLWLTEITIFISTNFQLKYFRGLKIFSYLGLFCWYLRVARRGAGGRARGGGRWVWRRGRRPRGKKPQSALVAGVPTPGVPLRPARMRAPPRPPCAPTPRQPQPPPPWHDPVAVQRKRPPTIWKTKKTQKIRFNFRFWDSGGSGAVFHTRFELKWGGSCLNWYPTWPIPDDLFCVTPLGSNRDAWNVARL